MRPAALTLCVSAVLALTACSGGGEPTSSERGTAVKPSTTMASPPRFTAADVRYVEALLTYRRQAVQLAEIAQKGATNPQVKHLSNSLPSLYRQEETKLRTLLSGWGRAVPPANAPPDEARRLPGMLTRNDLRDLETLTGATLDQRFLALLIGNQQGTVKLAAAAQENRGSGPARQSAVETVGAGTAFIANLTAIQASLR